MSSDQTDNPFDKRGFNPRSPDAMFATILAELHEQSRKQDRILQQVEKTNGRVTVLEQWREIVTAKVALIATGVSGAVGAAAWLADFISK